MRVPRGQRFRSGGAGAELSGRLRHDLIETAGRGAALTHSVRDLRARERVARSASNLVPAVARLDGGFLFRFFAAGLSYGVDRDDSPIARSRGRSPYVKPLV